MTTLSLGPESTIKLQVPAVPGCAGPSVGRARDRKYLCLAADHADHAQDLGASNQKC